MNIFTYNYKYAKMF